MFFIYKKIDANHINILINDFWRSSYYPSILLPLPQCNIITALIYSVKTSINN